MTRDDFEFSFVVHGPPCSKKRGKGALLHPFRGKGKPQYCPICKRKLLAVVINSSTAERWQRKAVAELESQWKFEPIPKTIPINARIVSYLPTARLIDADNLYAGPGDALQEAGILEDDCSIVSHDGSRRLIDRKNPRAEITLTPATIVEKVKVTG